MPDEEPDSSIEQGSEPIVAWARALALGLSGAFGTFGTIAVFVSSNQAGTAALLLIAAVLTLLGLQGTPLTKLVSGGNTVELSKIRRRARAAALDARSSDSPEVADAVVDALDQVFYPSILPNAPQEYTELVFRKIRKLFPYTSIIGGNLTLGTEISDGEDIVYINRQHRHRTLEMEDLKDARIAASTAHHKVIVVTNSPLSKSVREFNSHSEENIEVVSWNGPRDDEALARVISRNLQ
ncbi:hypothetical protein AB0I55_22165 [Actinocatenispora sera]|uniref:hypothetical protein n=1 Tax=Actinocatenispora sera TaxID=390989 RepID=UPI0033ED2FCA